MAKFELKGYDSYSGCDIIVTARLSLLNDSTKKLEEKVYTLGSLQTLSISTHQDKKPVRVIGSANALDYTLGQRTIAGSLVFAVFDQHFATEMFKDLEKATGKSFFLPDELPALDLTVTFANEYGRTSRMAIYGVRLINEGQVMSINDLYTENTYQFLALSMEPLTKGTQTGSSSNKVKHPYVATSFAAIPRPMAYSGEDVYQQGAIDDNINLKKVLLSVELEQPIFKDQEGIAKFTLSPNQVSGKIVIHNQMQNKIQDEITVEQKSVYSAFLESGMYSAWYENKGQNLSNTLTFSINSIGEYNMNYNDSPTIENITQHTIKISCNNPTHTVGVCTDPDTNKSIEVELKSKECTFNNLQMNHLYVLYTKSNTDTSETAVAKTLTEEEDYISNFKKYAEYNQKLLSKDIEDYHPTLNKLNSNEDIVYSLEKDNTEEAKELLYMAVKYKNEFTATSNHHKLDIMPKKILSNIYGNSFKFNNNATKANIFLTKNDRQYYEASSDYPTEMTYMGKANKAYNVVAIDNEFSKSPKYMFYSYSDNDKFKIKQLYGDANILDSINVDDYSSKKYPELSLKCIAAANNKNIDIKLLHAPNVVLDNDCNLKADVNYKDVLGEKDKEYFVCISSLDQCLDKTPFRKTKILDKDDNILLSKYLTAINSKDTYAIWMEDSNFNVVSDLAFISKNEEIDNLNQDLIKEEVSNILEKIGLTRDVNNNDILSLILTKDVAFKNIYYCIAEIIIELNINNKLDYLYELFKIKFRESYINQDKYRTVVFDKEKHILSFDSYDDNIQIAHIGIKEDEFNVRIINNSQVETTNDYDCNLYYVIDNNPIVKSGFVLIYNNQIKTYYIRLEEK